MRKRQRLALFAVGLVGNEAQFGLYDGHLRLSSAGPVKAFVIGMRAGHEYQHRVRLCFIETRR